MSVTPENAMYNYYASKMNVRKRQVFIELKNNANIISAGAMQFEVFFIICYNAII